MTVDQALSLLWQAARPSPHLREAVELVEGEVQRLRRERDELIAIDAMRREAARIDGDVSDG